MPQDSPKQTKHPTPFIEREPAMCIALQCYVIITDPYKGWGHFYRSIFCADLVPNNSPPRFSQLPTNINPKPHMPGLTLNSIFLRSFPHLIPLSFYSQPHIHLSYHIHFTWTSLDRIIPVPKYYVRKGTLS